jgi:hypothetical protein
VTDTVAPDLAGVAGSSVASADYDNDGRLDFLLTGFNRWFSGGSDGGRVKFDEQRPHFRDTPGHRQQYILSPASAMSIEFSETQPSYSSTVTTRCSMM